MIRRPTDLYKAYEPWRRRLAGEKVAAHVDTPEPGFYRTRLVRGGPFVPVAIWIEQHVDKATGELIEPERFMCLVDGKPRVASEVWNFAVGNPISEAEYHRMMRGETEPKLKPEPELAAAGSIMPRKRVEELPPLF